MSSILTNNGAMVALQTLKGINSSMAKTQNEISTGKAVATAKDNAAVWAISKTMEADVQGFKGISDSLSLGDSTVAVARTAAESITELLKDMKGKIVSAQDPNVDRAKIQADITELGKQIETVIGAAQFNGLNLIDGTATSPVKILSSLNRDSTGAVTSSTIDITTNDLTAVKTAVQAYDVVGDPATALSDIETQIKATIDAAAGFGSAAKRIDVQRNFVSKLSDAMKSGIGSMVDADMEETSARLQALQVQQQLATQSLSIANQAPQALLSLFR